MGRRASFGAFHVARPPLAWLLGWLGLAIVVLALRGRRRILPAAVIVLLGLATLPLSEPADGTLRLTSLDVGMGDALVLGLPAGGAVLLDAGTAFDGWSAGEAIVTPFLAEMGFRRLRAAVPTHGDLDHVGGFPAVFRNFGVDELWEGGGTAEDVALRSSRYTASGCGGGFRCGGFEPGSVSSWAAPGSRCLLPATIGPGRESDPTSARSCWPWTTPESGFFSPATPGRRPSGFCWTAMARPCVRMCSRSVITVAALPRRGVPRRGSPQVALVSVRADPRRRLPDDGVLEAPQQQRRSDLPDRSIRGGDRRHRRGRPRFGEHVPSRRSAKSARIAGLQTGIAALASSLWTKSRGVRRRCIPPEPLRSSLRFGRNTLGIPPSRALSAGRLTGLGTHVTSSTGY